MTNEYRDGNMCLRRRQGVGRNPREEGGWAGLEEDQEITRHIGRRRQREQ